MKTHKQLEQELLKLNSEDMLLTSLLYDLDLLPEQLKDGSRAWYMMLIVCEHWKMLLDRERK